MKCCAPLELERLDLPGFKFQAYSVEGKLHKGVLEADSARQARAQLRDQGLTPYRVDVIAANDPAAGARFRPVALSSTQLTQLTRSLASLLEAGLTVEQAFNALIEQAESGRVRQGLAAPRGEVIAGNTIPKAVGVRVAFRRRGSRAALHRFVWKMPLVGRVLRHLDAARLAATLSILVGSGVPILQALEAGTGVMTLTPMREALTTAARGVREGMPLARALAATRAFPPVMVHLISSGETSGRLDEALERAARQQQSDIETRLAAFTALFEPAMILFMGGVVLTIVLAILLPIFQLNSLVGK